MFKLEEVMDGFRASAPQERGQHNPNVDYVPFEQMKQRILKIVDDFHGWVKVLTSMDYKWIILNYPVSNSINFILNCYA